MLATWLVHGFCLVTGFFLMPYVLRLLGDHQYGTWVFINSFVSYSGLLYLGMGETVSRYVARYEAEGRPEQVNQVVSLVALIYLCMSGFALLIAAALCWLAPAIGPWEGHELTQVRFVIVILGINLAISLCGSVCGGVLLGLRRFDLERYVSLAFELLRCALIFLFLTERWGLVTIALIYLCVTLGEQLSFAVLAFRCYPSLRVSPRLVRWSMFRECCSFSGMTMLSNGASALINSTDSIVIGLMLGPEAIVPYYIALRLTQFIRQPIEKIAHICLPTAGALSAEQDPRRLQRFLSTALGVVLLLITGMFIGGWYFGGDLIRAWMHQDYPQTHRILCILLAGQIVALPGGLFRAFLFGTGHARLPAVIYFSEAVCNLVISVLLCRQWGIEGVAWGTMIPAVVIELGILMPLAMRKLGVTMRGLWLSAVLPQLPPLGLLWAFSWFAAQQPWVHAGWPPLIGVSLTGGIVLGLAWLAVSRKLFFGPVTLAKPQ